MRAARLDFDDINAGHGSSSPGHGRAWGLDLRPDLPTSTDKLVGIDLTHIIHTSDVAFAKGGNGGGGNGGGGGGGGGTTSFAPYTSGPSSASADRLTDLIIGELPNITVYGGKGGPKQVDDILIVAELANIDGLYGILGQAGPTSVRTDGSLPATATMKFDIADVNAMGLDAFADVVLHEMGHSLGFGSIWSRLDLVTNGLFTGDNALAEYLAMGGSGSGIPVEQDGGAGTAGSHWDEELFNNELMTGYINEGENYFTAMSAASFADMGYAIATNYADLADPGYMFA